MLQMTWPGAPTIYYGDEAGMCGWTDPDNRRSYPWGHENKDLIAFHRDLIRIRRENRVLKNGSYCFLDGGRQWLAYGRFNRQEQMVVILNNSDKDQEIRVPVWRLGMNGDARMVSLMCTNETGYHTKDMYYPIERGCVHVSLERYSGLLLKARSKYRP